MAAMLDVVQREPVIIRGHERDVAVVLSAQEYERLRGNAVAEFQRFCDEIGERAAARGMNEAVLAELLVDEK